MATAYNLSDWIWVPDEENIILPAKVLQAFKAGEVGKVSVHKIVPMTKGAPLSFTEEQRDLTPKETKNLERMDPNSMNSIEDMVNLRALSENSILHNLRLRYSNNEIYTSVGAILVSVNPFRELPLYTAEMLQMYKDVGQRNLPPHVYGVAEQAYRNLTESGLDQSCIVSGESGAGKTEATKIFLQYIAEVSSQAAKQNKSDEVEESSDKVTLQEQILKANPLMEAFGNAKTVRNNNSSRFGKWIEIKFNNKKGTIIGGKIVQYLLEKSRVVAPARNERNYHIFYNLCAGGLMDSEVKRKFQVGDPRDYRILKDEDGGEDAIYVSSLNDERNWEDVLQGMTALNISFKEQDDVLRTLAGILHLGNLEFVVKEGTFAEDSEVGNKDMLALTASQLGTTAEALEEALCTQKINTVRETTTRPLNPELAADSRDALAKALYANMFDWLIDRINVSFAQNHPKGHTSIENTSIIGVLDIFGFEVFQKNSLEQLCINYCNEKLQFHFNNHIFELEEKLYASEGIDVSKIDFKDNMPTINLFEKKGTGIFGQLDEQMFLPSGTDLKLLDNLGKVHKKHPNFGGKGVKTNYERESFLVIHYAGPVRYSVIGFLVKNSDKVSEDINNLIRSSTIDFVAGLAPEEPAAVNGVRGTGTRVNNRKKGASLCTKFKNQLNLLMQTLTKTEPQFIRCIKPNNEKVGAIFTAELVMEQLRYAGLLEVCRIRKLGYPIRRDFRQFLFRYGCLIEDFSYSKDNVSPQLTKKLCVALKDAGLLEEGEFQMGSTKVFLRGPQVDMLEARREIALTKQALTVQRFIRGWLERRKYVYYKTIISALALAVGRRNEEAINLAIDDYAELPYGGRHRPELAEARTLLHLMEENLRVIQLLQDAVTKADMNVLKSSLEASSVIQVVKNFKETELEEAKTEAKVTLDRLIEEQNAREALQAAMEDRSLEKITIALQKLSELGLSDIKEYQQGEVMRVKLEEIERIILNIQQAVKDQDLNGLQDALTSAADYAELSGDERVIKGREERDRLFQELAEEEDRKKEEERMKLEEDQRIKVAKALDDARNELIAAVKDQEFALVLDLKNKAIGLGMEKAELEGILNEVEAIEKINEQVDSLNAAMEGLKLLMLNKNGISRQDMNYLSDVIDKAREQGLTEDNDVLRSAVMLEDTAHKQLEAQSALANAIEEKDFNKLKSAINEADELNLEIDLLINARELLKEENFYRGPQFNNAERRSVRLVEPLEGEDLEQEAVRRREQMITEASNNKYDFKKYYNIRSPGDYVRGVFFNKRRLIESQLKHQTSVIPKSILNLRKEFNKPAIAINKSILGYCGEQSMQFPATLAQDILEKGLRTPELVDEIYIQICKHITLNERPESMGRAWQLMCLAVGTFPPSTEFEFYLMNFLVKHNDEQGLVGQYASYSLRRLDGMLVRGASGFLPTLDEILAFKQRPPVLTTIEMVDGTPLTQDLPVPPDLNVERVVEICLHFLSLQDRRNDQFGIFVVEDKDFDLPENIIPQSGYSAMRMGNIDDIPPPPPPEDANAMIETPHPLRDSDFLGDVVVAMTRKNAKFNLVFKKKLFEPNDDERSDSDTYRRLIYLQAADEVVRGNVLVHQEKDLLLLTAIALKIDLPGESSFPRSEDQMLDCSLMEYIPFNWEKKKRQKEWAQAVFTKRGAILRKSIPELEQTYIDIVRKLPQWGFNFFYVRERLDGNDMICGVKYEGLSFFSPQRKLMRQYEFKVIERWGGSSTMFWILVWNSQQKARTKVSLYTKQARDISNLILDYTKLRSSRMGE